MQTTDDIQVVTSAEWKRPTDGSRMLKERMEKLDWVRSRVATDDGVSDGRARCRRPPWTATILRLCSSGRRKGREVGEEG